MQLWRVLGVASVIHPVLDDVRSYTVEANLELLNEAVAVSARSLATGDVVSV